jgi:hypothetical protein
MLDHAALKEMVSRKWYISQACSGFAFDERMTVYQLGVTPACAIIGTSGPCTF